MICSRMRVFPFAGLVAPILFAVIFTLDGLLAPGYSAYDEAISYLDLGASGWIQRANFIVFGLLLMTFAIGYAQVMRPVLGRSWVYAITAFLALSNVGWIMAGVFVPNTYLAPQNSGHALLHQIASIVVFLPFAMASLIQGIKLIATRKWRLYGMYCLLVGVIQAIFPIGTTVYFIHPEVVGNVNSPGSGLFNRVALLIGPLTWYVILGCIVVVRSRVGKSQMRASSLISAG